MKVLIVEDDEKSLRLMKMIVLHQKVDLLVAFDGPSAVELAENNQIDLFLLDIQLPGMSGREIVSILRGMDKYKETPMVAVTALAMPKEIKGLLACGFTECFTKPIDVRLISETIKKHKETLLNSKG